MRRLVLESLEPLAKWFSAPTGLVNYDLIGFFHGSIVHRNRQNVQQNEHSPRDLQQDFLRRYLDLAHRLNLPLVIHCRDAFEDLFRILDDGPPVRGVLHCFTGTLAEARQVIARNWYLSLSGIITFKKSESLREVASKIPLDHLFIETDAPYLAPQSHRGKRNEPSYVGEVAKTIADAKGLGVDEVCEVTAHNVAVLLRLDHPRKASL